MFAVLVCLDATCLNQTHSPFTLRRHNREPRVFPASRSLDTCLVAGKTRVLLKWKDTCLAQIPGAPTTCSDSRARFCANTEWMEMRVGWSGKDRSEHASDGQA